MNLNTNAIQTQNQKPRTLGSWLAENKNNFEIALPKGTINIDRFIQAATLTIADPKQPLLAQCSKDSIFRALKESASLGLEVGGVLGQAFLIPYNENVRQPDGNYQKVMTCHFQMGYKGLIALARRSNTIKTIACEAIHENDIFEVQLGCNRNINHKIDITRPRGKIIGYYCLVELVNGGIQFDVESVSDIENHRNKFSKAYKPEDPNNIWNKNFDAMALKTCAIQALKLCPISIEALEAVRRDEMSDIKEDDQNQTSATVSVKESFEDAEFSIQQPSQSQQQQIGQLEPKKQAVEQSAQNTNINTEQIASEAMADTDLQGASNAFDIF